LTCTFIRLRTDCLAQRRKASVFYAIYYFVLAKDKKNRKAIAFVMALGVLSHWFAGLIVHQAQLP
jgi:hypothetical protein